MRHLKPKVLALAMSLALASFSPVTLANDHSLYQSRLSANIPLNSHVYDQLEKLDGLGYIQSMRIGAKPYTRMQAAGWIKEAALRIDSHDARYVHAILAELLKEFNDELTVLDGGTFAYGMKLQEWSVGFAKYDGPSIDQSAKTNSVYQPFAVNSDGYRLSEDGNLTAAIRLEGKVAPSLVVSLTSRADGDLDDHLSFPAAYIKTHINNVSVQIGKDAMLWGQGKRGSLVLTNNATPRKTIALSNIKPIQTGGIFKFLGEVNIAGFYSELEKNRDSEQKQPGFSGLRFDFVPSDSFTFGMARTDIVRGLRGDDFFDFLIGKNADNTADEKWNSIAGIDFRWRLKGLGGAQVYGELYGEDQAGSLIPFPSKNAYLMGVYLPRLSSSGDWDAQLEWADTNDVWYSHWKFTDGYTYKGNIMGDAMGNNANRYYGKLTHYLNGATQVSLHGEQVKMEQLGITQTVNSAWVSMRTKVGQDLFVDAALGKAKVKNHNFTPGQKDDGIFTSLQISQQF